LLVIGEWGEFGTIEGQTLKQSMRRVEMILTVYNSNCLSALHR